MKPSTFFWSWNDHSKQPDPSMTRTRAARLLWAWRKTSRRPTSMGAYLRSLTRIRAGVYRVVDRASGESATMFITGGKRN